MTDLALFATGIACFLLGLLALWLCVHLPARRKWKAERTEHARAILSLEADLHSAEADIEWARVELATAQRQLDADETMLTLAAQEIERLRGDDPSAVVVPIEAGRR